jgi:predicted TIM-barrel fold metal-dependent hydrolase
MTSAKSKSAVVRARLKHPVIDSDGHFSEYLPVVREYLIKHGGEDLVKRFFAGFSETFIGTEWYDLSSDQRRDMWTKRPPFYGAPAENTLDLATSLFPKLLYDRLDEIGLDYTVLYPGVGFIVQLFFDEELRRASCRALNDYYADFFGEFPDRITPVATIPMHTPEEAIDELEYAVRKRGLKVVLLPSYVRRPIPAIARKYPEAARYAYRLDTFGIDSDYDYDPVWAKCLELKVVPTFHGPGEGLIARNSISNYVYNHIGHFAAAGDTLCKSLFLGGVTRRFPRLKFLFLEGGVGWGRTLLSDLASHWEKRNRDAVVRYAPDKIDRERFFDLYQRYGGKMYRESLTFEEAALSVVSQEQDPATIDDFARCGIKRKEDIRDLFVSSFYFGCEADDPVTSSAFDPRRNPFNVRLNAVFGSDIGHWDVPDMTEVLEEAYESIDKGFITEDDFRDFVFTNPVKLWTAINPDFFKGTVVEGDVRRFLSAS